MINYISKYLSLYRASYSDAALAAGIKNIPSNLELAALKLLGENIYDKVCDHFGIIFASSVFRSKKVNSLIGGSATSSHVKGEAIDLDGDAPSNLFSKVDNNILFKWIKDNLVYDQLIAEFESNGAPQWVHASYRAKGNRQQVLIATKSRDGSTVYMAYTDSLYKKVYRSTKDTSFVGLDVFEMPDIDYKTVLNENVNDSLLAGEFIGNKDALPSQL